jgi:hypothetical protein
VSHPGHPSPCSPYLSPYLLPLYPQLLPMYISTILHSYTPLSDVYLPPTPLAILYSLPCSSTPIFAFFGLLMDTFLLLLPSPITMHVVSSIFIDYMVSGLLLITYIPPLPLPSLSFEYTCFYFGILYLWTYTYMYIQPLHTSVYPFICRNN